MAQAKRINLALQGGGAHGAFTWGALDRLLEDERIEIAAISGTSAGALNGAAIKCGLVTGDRDKAKAGLEALWTKVGAITDEAFGPWLNAFSPMAISRAIEYSLPFALSDTSSRTISPYLYRGTTSNPLRRIVEGFDFDNVCSEAGPQFHICATNVRSGKIRVFTRRKSQLMRSSPLPVCPHCSRPSKLMEKPTGTADTPAIPRYFRCFTRTCHGIFWS